MVSDPDDPGYRYPAPRERLWHVPTHTWVTIEGQPSYGPISDEVAGISEKTKRPVVVKLRSLEDRDG